MLSIGDKNGSEFHSIIRRRSEAGYRAVSDNDTGALRTEPVLPQPYHRHENSNPDSLLIAAKMAGGLALAFVTMVGYLALR